jgi:hypothetical protein
MEGISYIYAAKSEHIEMYRELFRQVIFLFSQPGKAWKELVEREDSGDEFLTKFVYPLMGLGAASVFVGALFTRESINVGLAVKSSVNAVFSLFGGFFMSSWLLNKIWTNYLGREDDLRLWRQFVGYSSVAMFVVYIVFPLIPLLPLFEYTFPRVMILSVATMYVVWEGVSPFMKIGEKIRLRFTLLVSAVIVLLPELIRVILFMMLPGLRV